MRFRFENKGQDILQLALLVLGAALVLMPLFDIAGKGLPAIQEKNPGEHVRTQPGGGVMLQEDLTKQGVSKIDAMFILREKSRTQEGGMT